MNDFEDFDFASVRWMQGLDADPQLDDRPQELSAQLRNPAVEPAQEEKQTGYYSCDEVQSVDIAGYEPTSAATPMLLATGVDACGQAVVNRITRGVHWNDQSWPSWLYVSTSVPTVSQISDIADNIRVIFGFQFDATVSAFELLMSQLDSRAARCSPEIALRSLHADYIGGPQANFRQWYFAAQLDRVDRNRFVEVLKGSDGSDTSPDDGDLEDLENQTDSWAWEMSHLSDTERVVDILLWLLCWTEANQLRFMPECLAFIVYCARQRWRVCPKGDIKYPSSRDTEPRTYLETIVTPLYRVYRDFNFEQGSSRGEWIRRCHDHKDTVGYDDMNQLFWSWNGLQRLHLADETRLVDLDPSEWWDALGGVKWGLVFRKTYRESRSWLHMATNFSRIWILHGAVFWIYTSLHAPAPAHTRLRVRWIIASLGGLLGPIITLAALVGEWRFVPRSFAQARPVLPRACVALGMLIVLAAPATYILAAGSWTTPNMLVDVLSGVLFGMAVLYTLYFSVQPLAYLAGSPAFGPRKNTDPKTSSINSTHATSQRRWLANHYFTAQFPALNRGDRILSWSMAILVLVAKLTESYAFLTLSLRDPMRELSTLSLSHCPGDALIGRHLCRAYPWVVLAGVVATDMVLFFLDTYLWYVIFATLVSVVMSFGRGGSVWTPWREVYCRLPARVSSKLLWGGGRPDGVARVWNAIVISMRRNHLLSRAQFTTLRYGDREPAFFAAEQDGPGDRLGSGEAARRISFFAQSLATPLPSARSVSAMPAFTVLVPHFTEKIILGLRETIAVDAEQRVTLLEYLQKLHPKEWECFVAESKARHSAASHEAHTRNSHSDDPGRGDSWNRVGLEHRGASPEEASVLALDTLGFASSDPRDTHRTRLWASRRTQTLYRTITGFANYAQALRILRESDSNDGNEDDAASLVERKFRLLVAMQRYATMSFAELMEVEALFAAFPALRIVSVDCDISSGHEDSWYASLIDGSCPILSGGRRQPRLRIALSGNPLLGDGKSDNQNHALPFYRGEYIQLVDANQDHYLEECLKIRNVLREFQEEFDSSADVYTPQKHPYESPVAIVGAREYIFSENIGVLGDVAAAKEQTFGTLFARTLARVGGKLHYGHPDFLNGVFMTTRGGVSKAQQGLHLNEDIYAGMTALCRGGRIRHCEYVQCGKGRDLGFGSILNFTAKIGAGMGEQLLSREYFWLGTQLPFDRFLSFFYAHAGFHLNNVFITLSLDMLLAVVLWISALGVVDASVAAALLDWVRRCVVSIVIVFFIALCPLFFQELSEKGLRRAVTRELRHLASLSMLFEVFVCRVYARSFLGDLRAGGAKYVATGRTFATHRVPFHILYQGYAEDCLSFGLQSAAVLVAASVLRWHTAYLWFCTTSAALCFSPSLYNPHQFAVVDFFVDYRRLLFWLAGRNGWSKWGRESHYHGGIESMLRSQIFPSVLRAAVIAVPYFFLGSQRLWIPKPLRLDAWQDPGPGSALYRICVITSGPVVAIMVINTLAIIVSIVGSQGVRLVTKRDTTVSKFGSVVALMARLMAVVTFVLAALLMYVLERHALAPVLLGMLIARSIQQALEAIIGMISQKTGGFNSSCNAFYASEWASLREHDGIWRTILAIPIEIMAQTADSLRFTDAFLTSHLLLAFQLPFLVIPGMDMAHTTLLLWLRPSAIARTSLSTRTRRHLRNTTSKYAALFCFVVIILGISAVLPAILPTEAHVRLQTAVTSHWPGLIH